MIEIFYWPLDASSPSACRINFLCEIAIFACREVALSVDNTKVFCFIYVWYGWYMQTV